MSHAINLFRTLERDWHREGASPRAQMALARWAADQPALAGFGSPLEVVRRCHDRSHGDESRALVAALLAWSKRDRLAARTVLQVVLPGLASISRRSYGFVGSPSGVWQAIDELDQHVVAVAYERIHALAAAGDSWGAMAIVDSTWQRIRTYALAELRRRDQWAPLGECGTAELRAGPGRSVAEELVVALLDAVARGVLGQVDAGIIYASRIEGHGVEALAPVLGCEVRSVFRRRARAEQRLGLAAAGWSGSHAARAELAVG